MRHRLQQEAAFTCSEEEKVLVSAMAVHGNVASMKDNMLQDLHSRNGAPFHSFKEAGACQSKAHVARPREARALN